MVQRCVLHVAATYARGRVDRIETAQTLYQRSVDIKRSASGLFNLGVTHYHLSELFFITTISSTACENGGVG